MSQKRQLQQLLSVWPICVSECVPFCALPCVCIESVSCQTPSLHWHPLLPLQYTFSCPVCTLSCSVSLSRSLFVFMKNYKSASQLKYFRLSEQQCAIENSYLAIGICPEICNGNWAIGQRGNPTTSNWATGQLVTNWMRHQPKAERHRQNRRHPCGAYVDFVCASHKLHTLSAPTANCFGSYEHFHIWLFSRVQQ